MFAMRRRTAGKDNLRVVNNTVVVGLDSQTLLF